MTQEASNIVARLRHRSHTGRIIRQHRALRRLEFGARNWMHPTILPVLFSVGLVAALEPVLRFWAVCFEFWIARLELPGAVILGQRTMLTLTLEAVPSIDIPAAAPTELQWLGSFVAICLLMLLSYIFGRGRYLPLVYIVWALCLLHALALLYFRLSPVPFPHDVAGHVKSGVEMTLALIFICPWLLAVSYYPLEFSLWSKLLVTLLITGAIVLLTPFQYSLHAWIVHEGSLLFMPTLFVFFGIFIAVVIFVALYGWAASWRH